jgi:conjugal transfer pilus assembly protein TraU
VPVPGIPVGFWEPVRMADVTREPFCMVSLGGVNIGPGMPMKGVHSSTTKATNGKEHAFYHTHWYVYPILYWLEILMDFVCLEKSDIDVAWLSELDPTWNDEEMGFLINPESVLFANPIAQVACAADCAASSAHLPIDSMFWCAGCQGGVYPFSGTVEYHSGGVSSSLLIVEKLMAKMHRLLMLWETSGKRALCEKKVAPIIKKSQYRLQMTYPIAATNKTIGCHPMGKTSVFLETNREFPVKGEDFAYIIWRKRNCCVL